MRNRIALLGLLALLAQPSWANKSVYSWVDDKGVTHFGERPPAAADAREIRRAQSGTFAASAAASSADSIWQDGVAKREPDAQQNKISTDKIARLDLERCNAAIKNLELLNTPGPLRVTNDDGSSSPMSEAQKRSAMAKMQRAIDESCQDQSPSPDSATNVAD